MDQQSRWLQVRQNLCQSLNGAVYQSQMVVSVPHKFPDGVQVVESDEDDVLPTSTHEQL